MQQKPRGIGTDRGQGPNRAITRTPFGIDHQIDQWFHFRGVQTVGQTHGAGGAEIHRGIDRRPPRSFFLYVLHAAQVKLCIIMIAIDECAGKSQHGDAALVGGFRFFQQAGQGIGHRLAEAGSAIVVDQLRGFGDKTIGFVGQGRDEELLALRRFGLRGCELFNRGVYGINFHAADRRSARRPSAVSERGRTRTRRFDA